MKASPTRKRAHLDNDGGGRPAARFHLRFDHRAARLRGRRCLQLHHFGLQRHHLEKLIDAGPLRRRNRNRNRFAAPIFRCQLAFLKLLLHSIDVRRRQIDLVDRDHDLHVRRGLGVIDCFDRLRHQAVIGRDHQHDDVGDDAPRARIAVNAA